MTTLSERIRPNRDAAPWVIQAIKELEQQLAAKEAEALDIAEIRELLLILRRKIGGALWSLEDEEEELAVRVEKAIAALAAHRKQGGEV